jgi:hypothetical protein
MALPTRKKHLLPSLDSFELEENNSDYNEGITLVSDKEEYNDLEEISTEETQTLTDEDFIEEKKEEIIKEREKKESHNKRFKFNIKNLKKIDLNIKKFLNFKNLPKINLNTSSYKIIIGFILFIIIISFIFSKFILGKSNNNEIKENISYSFKNEEYQGIVFTVKSSKNAKINLQRIYKEDKGNLVLCEAVEQEIEKDKEQDVYLTCLNNTEEVSNTSNKLIKDNIVEIE